MSPRILITLLSAAAFLGGPAACKGPSDNTTDATPDATIGIDVAAMDTSVRPGDDFYDYANGHWMQTTDIPADRASTGSFLIAFEEVERRNTDLVAEIVNATHEPGTDGARIAAYYKAYVDTAAIDAAGMKPIQPELDRIAAVTDNAELSAELGASLRADVDPLNYTNYFTENLFGVFVTQGLATPGEVLPYVLQGGLGLPEREYYLSDSPKMAKLRTAYRAFIEELLTAAGINDAAAKADRIFALESRIAAAHVDRETSEDFSKSLTVWTRAELEANAPGIDWPVFLAAAQLADQPKFAAYHAPAITGLAALVASEPLDAWKDWLLFHRISSHAHVLPSAIDKARFAFYGTTLSGTPRQRERGKRALESLGIYLGDAVGRAYVDRYFPASAKAEIEAMVDNILEAFRQRVSTIEWMAPETKQEALNKVNTIRVGVGYPDSWRDYSSYDVDPSSAYANVVNGEKFEYAHQLAKIGKPMDRDEWWMNAHIVNAINLPVQNAINFPAGILLHPFFDPDADPAFNYGAIGMVIGHEISHSFDNNGAVFDADGVYRNWWTPEDFAQFQSAGDALVRQYDAYAPFDDLHVNGRLTLGENIADLAGLEAGYDAYRASLGGSEPPVIGGFTGDQRFFIGYAQSWATKMRDEALRQRVLTDGHAPGQYRALTVRNVDAWYDAFDVEPGDELYLKPQDRVRIW
jgi:putative endopeptidase